MSGFQPVLIKSSYILPHYLSIIHNCPRTNKQIFSAFYLRWRNDVRVDEDTRGAGTSCGLAMTAGCETKEISLLTGRLQYNQVSEYLIFQYSEDSNKMRTGLSIHKIIRTLISNNGRKIS